MPSFGIAALIGKVSDVGDGGSWSIEEMAALMDAKEKDAEMLEYAAPDKMNLMNSHTPSLLGEAACIATVVPCGTSIVPLSSPKTG
mgnify:CR=1 FL=1